VPDIDSAYSISSLTAVLSDAGHARRPLRVTLTLWMLVVFTLIQVTLGVVFYLYQQHSATQLFYRDLQTWLDAIVAELGKVDPPWSAAVLGDVPDPAEAGLPPDESISVAILDDGGGVVGVSNPRLLKPNRPELIRARQLGQSAIRISTEVELTGNSEDESLLVVMKQIPAGNSSYTVMLASTDRSVVRQLAVVRQTFLLGMPIGLIAAGVAGWYIAGVAVSPLAEVRRLAERISPESIGKPLDMEATNAEMASLRDSLIDALERLDRGYRAQERFISNVSHELKTPIAVVMTEAQALRMGDGLSERAIEFAESTEQEMRRLGRLVESFLMLTRVRDAGLPTMKLRCDVNDLLVESARHCDAFASEHGIHLVPSLIDDADSITNVIGDPDLLRTMIDNLVYNAIRFSPQGGAVVIEAKIQGDATVIRVVDDGPGLPPDLVDRIFDRFVQGPDEHRRGRGCGLGLEIAQGIAELHAGRIEVENGRDRGCAFRITLPLAAAAPA
jgi:signal transduction histidine kinase